MTFSLVFHFLRIDHKIRRLEAIHKIDCIYHRGFELAEEIIFV